MTTIIPDIKWCCGPRRWTRWALWRDWLSSCGVGSQIGIRKSLHFTMVSSRCFASLKAHAHCGNRTHVHWRRVRTHYKLSFHRFKFSIDFCIFHSYTLTINENHYPVLVYLVLKWTISRRKRPAKSTNIIVVELKMGAKPKGYYSTVPPLVIPTVGLYWCAIADKGAR